MLLAGVAWRAATSVQAQGGRQQLDFSRTIELRLASNGDVAVLVALSAVSDLAVLRSVNGGPFVPTEFVVPPILERRVWGVWATTHGFFAVQHTRGLLPRLSRSVDGARWETISSPAFETPADINGMVQLASGDLLAVGLLRGSTSATFRPAMWRSSDGITWQRVRIVGPLAEASSFGSIATLATTIVVQGQRSGVSTLWRSDDAGASWTSVAGGSRESQSVAAIGDRFVRFSIPLPIEAPDVEWAWSNDGRVWREGIASGLLESGLNLFPGRVSTTASGVFLTGGTQLDFRKRLDWCYAAPTTCTNGSGTTAVLHTTTGDTWRVIDVGSLLGPQIQAFAVTDTKAGTVIAAATPGRIEVITVPPASWSFVTPQAAPKLPPLPALATSDGSIDGGVVYRYPLGVHCGLNWLGRFNGRWWKLERQLVGGDPRALATVPQFRETLLGTIRLTAPDTVEYSIDGIGVVAVYRPTSETPPMCL